MTNHAKYDEVKKLIDASIPVLLTGEAGSGKTTLAKQIADDMKLPFRSMSMTRQTTLSHILGFLSVNGTYVKSVFRTCFQDGGMMLLDEIDGGDPNVLLAFNTIENGYVTFPDELVKCHPDFRLVATANPQDQHNFYTGRSKLDAATLDRFDIIDVERDDKLECSLVDNDTHNRMQLMRKIMGEHNASKTVSMRDALRYQKRKELNLVSENFVACLADKSSLVLEQYYKQVEDIPKHQDQSECKSYDELVDLLKVRAGSSDFPKDNTNITSDNPYGEPKDEPNS
jgi:MoxR-like ATPase